MEMWKDIPGYENLYQASTLGRIKSKDRNVKRSDNKVMNLKGKVLKQFTNPSNRYFVSISDLEGNKKTQTVHKLVALTFIGKRPDNMEVCHIDGNKLNNKINNLCYDTKTENAYDKVRQQRKIAPMANFEYEEIRDIKYLYFEKKLSITKIKEMYKVDRSIISNIVNGKTYSFYDSSGNIKKSKTRIYYQAANKTY